MASKNDTIFYNQSWITAILSNWATASLTWLTFAYHIIYKYHYVLIIIILHFFSLILYKILEDWQRNYWNNLQKNVAHIMHILYCLSKRFLLKKCIFFVLFALKWIVSMSSQFKWDGNGSFHKPTKFSNNLVLTLTNVSIKALLTHLFIWLCPKLCVYRILPHICFSGLILTSNHEIKLSMQIRHHLIRIEWLIYWLYYLQMSRCFW